MASGEVAKPESEARVSARLIVAALKRAGIDLIATLPDTWMGELIDEVDRDPTMTLVRVASEHDGVGICAGAFLGGRKAALVAQNGGMLLSVNPLAAFAMHHQIPIVMLLVHRGSADDNQFYQVYKARATVPVLEALALPYHFVESPADFTVIEEAARESILGRVPVAILFSRRAMIGQDKPKG